MTNLASLDSKIRRWLKRIPLSAIVVLLEAVRDEVGSRAAARRPLIGSREEAHFLRAWTATQWGYRTRGLRRTQGAPTEPQRTIAR